MDTKKIFIYTYTLVTSGFVYLITYILLETAHYSDVYILLSYFVGAFAYILIRLLYKSEKDHDLLLARAYRYLIWSVPLVLLCIKLVIYYSDSTHVPSFKEFYSVEDLSWSGIFIIVFWPLLNFFVLIENIFNLIWIAVFYIGFSVLVGLYITIFVLLVFLYKKLIILREQSIIEFSLTIATILTTIPLIAYMFIAYLWL